MPRISEFLGMIIAMYYNDHAPPHFHVTYAGDEALIRIDTLEVLTGALPRRVLSLVIEWAIEYRSALQANWEKAREGLPLDKIPPLA